MIETQIYNAALLALTGNLFVFISRRGIQMKILYFDRSGLCTWSKRLEAGSFISDWRQARTREMDWTSLKLLLEGIEPGRLRKRYKRPEDSVLKGTSAV